MKLATSLAAVHLDRIEILRGQESYRDIQSALIFTNTSMNLSANIIPQQDPKELSNMCYTNCYHCIDT